VAAATPTIEPLEIRAGDSIEWEMSLSDYPAPTWVLSYHIRGPVALDITASADSSTHAVTITPDETATLQAGEYRMFGRVTDGTDVITVYNSRLVVLPNLTGQGAIGEGYDARSWNRKCLDAIKGMFEGVAPHPEIAYTLFGERNVQLIPVADRLKMLAAFESRVAEEDRNERASRGEKTGIYMRFTTPT
jgi:hypothetical protein